MSIFHSKSGKNLLVFLLIVLVGGATGFLIGSYYSPKEYLVTVTDKDIKNSSDDSKYLVFTELENGETRVFSVQDSLIKWRFDSSDDYAEIEIGKTYRVEVIGWRIPLFSQYENIIECYQVID